MSKLNINSKFNINKKLEQAILNYLIPKLFNICEIFDIIEIKTDNVQYKEGDLNKTIKYRFSYEYTNKNSIKIKKFNIKKEFESKHGFEYNSDIRWDLESFEKSKIEYTDLMLMSELFLEQIKKYEEKQNLINDIIKQINALEIIYVRELFVEKIKRKQDNEESKKTRRNNRRGRQMREEDFPNIDLPLQPPPVPNNINVDLGIDVNDFIKTYFQDKNNPFSDYISIANYISDIRNT